MRSRKAPTRLPSPAEAAAAIREELVARGWPTSAEVGRANGSHYADPATWAKTKREARELLGVWWPKDDTYRHPSFQFYADGTLNPQTRELLIALAKTPDYAPLADPTGWRRAFWLYSSSYVPARLDGELRVRADVFMEDPDAVIQLAHSAANSPLSW